MLELRGDAKRCTAGLANLLNCWAALSCGNFCLAAPDLIAASSDRRVGTRALGRH